MSEFHSSLIFHCMYVIFCLLFIHQWTLRWLLRLAVIWCRDETWVYKYLFETLLSILLVKHPKLEFLYHMDPLFWGTTILFSIVTTPFTFPSTAHKDSSFLTSLPMLSFSGFSDSNHPHGCTVTVTYYFNYLLSSTDFLPRERAKYFHLYVANV